MDDSSDAKTAAFSSADRIRQLNEIDRDVAKLVNSAGLAIQELANDKTKTSTAGNSIEERKAAFKTATSQYFALLSSIDVRLRRQVYALEEAGILDSEPSAGAGSFRGDAAGGASATAAGGSAAAAGSFNPLEISWLNSRKDTVGKDKEAESWATARELVKRLRGQTRPDNETDKMDTD